MEGPGEFLDLGQRGQRRDETAGVAWSYPKPLKDGIAGAEALANCVAFYPAGLDYTVGRKKKLRRNLAVFTGAGSRPGWSGHSRLKRALNAGKQITGTPVAPPDAPYCTNCTG